MKKAGYSHLILALSLSTCTPGPETRSSSQYHPNGNKMKSFEFYESIVPGKAEPDTVLSGRTIEWDSSGIKRSQKSYRDGKQDGLSIEFFPDGQDRVHYFHRKGVLDSIHYFDEKKRLRERVVYDSGKATVFFIDEYGNPSEGKSPAMSD